MREVIDGIVALIHDPDIDLAGLMEHIKGPDFPTGGVIMGRSGIQPAPQGMRQNHAARPCYIEENPTGVFRSSSPRSPIW